jgi:hypothetical protein
MSTDPRQRFIENPFFVLGLPIDCARADAEREASKLLGLLALGVASATRYRSPLGAHDRTADDVRRAIADLRDPARRLLAEVWAAAPIEAERSAGAEADAATATEPTAPTCWPDALDALALRPRTPRSRP